LIEDPLLLKVSSLSAALTVVSLPDGCLLEKDKGLFRDQR
jgi:hypothetical protein